MTRNFDPALMSFLPQSVVDAELKARGAQFTKVTFAKQSGEVTTRTGMPKVQTRRVGGDKGPAATPDALKRAASARKGLADSGNLFWDYPQENRPDGKRGFSFNKGRVIAIGDSGVHPE